MMFREDIRNLKLGYPSFTNKNFMRLLYVMYWFVSIKWARKSYFVSV